MKTAITNFEDWKALQSFQNVVSEYQNRYFSSRTLKARDYEALHISTHTEVIPSCIITASADDLAADIASAIHSGVGTGSITERQANYYRRYYESGRVVVVTQADICEDGRDIQLDEHAERFSFELQASVRQIDRKVRLAIGKVFIAKGISPIKEYLRPIDTRKNMRAEVASPHAKRTVEFKTLHVAAKKAVAA